jgi:prepilin-type N-terminal cleavage/methylation domain-containing protein
MVGVEIDVRVRGFTLIELLVVVAIVALLASMLLPSMTSARANARSAVCLAHTSGIGRASASYQTEFNGWLPGSPGTSGSVMYGVAPDGDQTAEDINTDPSQIWDYAGSLAPTYMNMSLPSNRAEKMEVVRSGIFRCPENDHLATPIRGSVNAVGPVGSFDIQPMASYNTFRNFLMWPRTMVDWNPSRPWGPLAPVPEASFDSLDGGTLQPRSYRPQIGKIVNPSMKVFLGDGNRFTDPRDDTITYDVEWKAQDGGAFCNGGPTMPEWNGSWPVLSSYHHDRLLGNVGYRHRVGGSRGIAVNFFDGHGAMMSEADSREPDYWWPKGTKIPFQEFNDASIAIVFPRLGSDFSYRVGR